MQGSLKCLNFVWILDSAPSVRISIFGLWSSKLCDQSGVTKLLVQHLGEKTGEELLTFNGEFGGGHGLAEDALDVLGLVVRIARHVDAQRVRELLVQHLVLGSCKAFRKPLKTWVFFILQKERISQKANKTILRSFCQMFFFS